MVLVQFCLYGSPSVVNSAPSSDTASVSIWTASFAFGFGDEAGFLACLAAFFGLVLVRVAYLALPIALGLADLT